MMFFYIESNAFNQLIKYFVFDHFIGCRRKPVVMGQFTTSGRSDGTETNASGKTAAASTDRSGITLQSTQTSKLLSIPMVLLD